MPGVFCAGEMLDWEAPTGGYLLTACLRQAEPPARARAEFFSKMYTGASATVFGLR